ILYSPDVPLFPHRTSALPRVLRRVCVFQSRRRLESEFALRRSPRDGGRGAFCDRRLLRLSARSGGGGIAAGESGSRRIHVGGQTLPTLLGRCSLLVVSRWGSASRGRRREGGDVRGLRVWRRGLCRSHRPFSSEQTA